MSTTRIPPLQRHAKRVAALPICSYCGDPIKTSSRRPRFFCGDRCRQRAHREKRDSRETAKPIVPKEFRDAVELGRDLLGHGACGKGPRLGPDLREKIIRCEIGWSDETVISADGVVSFVICPSKK